MVLPLREVALVVAPQDNLAVARKPIEAGTVLSFDHQLLTIKERVFPKHKFLLKPVQQGEPLLMYGEVVGLSTRNLEPGEVLHKQDLLAEGVHRCEPRLASRRISLNPPHPMPYFQGIDRGPAGVGTRNHLLLCYTVPCARIVTEKIAMACRLAYGYEVVSRYLLRAQSKLRKPQPSFEASRPFPGVDGIVVLHHEGGCGMPDYGDVDTLMQWIAHYIRNPNVGGALVLGLGCEKTTLNRLEKEYLEPIREHLQKPIRLLNHQTMGAESAIVEAGIDAVYEILTQINRVERKPFPLSALVLGTKCGGSDGFSGLSANPALGVVSDWIVSAGGAVLLPEVPEMFGAEQILAERAISEEVGKQVLALVDRYREYAGRIGVSLNENPSLGNIEDGLLSIQMKSLGAIRKAGNAPVAGVLEYAQWVPGPGLYLLDTPGYDVISTSALPASGATIGVFTTGLGTPFGNPIMPVVKVSTNSTLARRMPDVIDFDAGTIIEGKETIEEVGKRLLQLILEVASGELTKNELSEHRESAFWQRQVNL